MKKFLKIIISIILGAITGPLELLVMDLVLKNNHSDFWLLYVIGLMILYSFVYKILLVIFNLILYKKDEFGVHISTIFSCLSMIITYYILCRYVEDYGIITSIILVIVIAVPNQILFIPWFDGGSNYNNLEKENSKKEPEKKPNLKIKTAYMKDQFGNITGTADTVSYSDKYGSWETTEFKDNFGNVKGKIDKYN